MKIPFLNFSFMHSELKNEMCNVFDYFIDNSQFILGPSVNEFEQNYSEFNNVKYTIGVSNGLDALILSLKSLNIGKGDEVILPSNTYIATLLAVSHLGAKPVLVEPNINTYNIEVGNITDKFSKKTKCIIPVHLYGQSCKMLEILNFANKSGIYVVEDNAQSQGAMYKGKKTGSWGHANATSFYPGKNLGALGDAGAVTTNDFEVYNKVKQLRNYGSIKKYYNEVIGYNMRLDELQAALLNVKLKSLSKWNSERIKIANYYNEYLKELDDLVLPSLGSDCTSVYHLYVIRTKKRDDLQSFLQEKGINTLIHYPVPPHLQKAYSDLNYRKGDFPIAEELANTMISLPIWPGMTETELNYICDNIKVFFQK